MAELVRVVDVETSGLPEDECHALVEIGWVDVHVPTLSIRGGTSHLVNPGHPIPPRIRAIHHIGDRDVAGAMSPGEAIAALLTGLSEDDVLCAHHAAFERHFIDAGARRWICTMKVGYRAWPEFFSHGNQALRYELGVDEEPDFDPARAMPPHRALPDAYVTAFILRELLRLRPVTRLIELTEKSALLPWITFGKHYGKKFSEVEIDYLQWMVRQEDMDADKKATAQYWLGKRA